MLEKSSKYYQFKSKLKSIPYDAGWHLRFNQSYIKNARGSRILVYHGICQEKPFQFNTLFITLKTFENHLRFYKKYFNVISLDDVYQQKFSDKKFNICLSFDDGFANNYNYVLPLLEKYELPAHFFITGIREAGYDFLWNDLLSIAYKIGPANLEFDGESFIKGADRKYISIDTGEKLSGILQKNGFEKKSALIKTLLRTIDLKKTVHKDYWLQMEPEEIRKLSLSKWVGIGSHGYYHNDLANIPLADAEQELILSKKYLETITEKEIRSIAFPYGSYSQGLVALTKNAGYSQLLGTEISGSTDKYEETLMERLTINPFISTINQAYANISGNYR